MTDQTKAVGSNAPHSTQPSRGTTNYAMRVFYALAIIFVVAGHSSINYPSGFNFGYNLFPIYAFHMPMFIFASGYFYSHRHESHPMRFIAGKARRLILPMYAIHALAGVFVMLLASKGFSAYEGVAPDAIGILVNPWSHLNMHEFEYDLATWFVIPMFLSQCIYMLLHRVVVHGETGSRRRLVSDSLLTAFLVGGGMVLIDCIGTGEVNELVKGSDWLRLCQTGCFLPFVAIGYYYHTYLEAHADKLPDIPVLMALAIIQLGLLFAYGSNLTMIMCWVGFPAGAVGTMLMGMTGTLFWLRISKILAPKLKDSWMTNEVGKNTFSIMAFHFFGFFALNCVFYAVMRLSGGHYLSAFSVEAFKAGGVYYKCVPVSMLEANLADSWGILYVMFGVGVPLVLHRIWSWAYGSARAWLGNWRRSRERSGTETAAFGISDDMAGEDEQGTQGYGVLVS